MRVALDTNYLLSMLDENAAVARDPATKQPVEKAQERISYLIASLSQAQAKIIIPTPVLAETLARAPRGGVDYLAVIDKLAGLELPGFDKRAALELASLEQQHWGPNRPAADSSRQKVKVDRQIVAICKVHGVETLYSDDGHMRSLANGLDIAVVQTHELPLAPEPPQREFEFENPQVDEEE